MIKIDSYVGTKKLESKKASPSRKNHSASFSSLLETSNDIEDPNQIFSNPNISQFSYINYIDVETPNQKAKKRGSNLIEILTHIRNNLIDGVPSINEIQKLEALLKHHTKDTFVSPKLQEIIDEIELRVAVEIEKHNANYKFW